MSRRSKNGAWRRMLRRLRSIRIGDVVERSFAPHPVGLMGTVTRLYEGVVATSSAARYHGTRVEIRWSNGTTYDGPLVPSSLRVVGRLYVGTSVGGT